MTSSIRHSVTRRSILTGMIASLALTGNSAVGMHQPLPGDLGHGLEIRDYRVFPTPDVMRFIVEIHNVADVPIDTPAVGVVLPHLAAESNFGVANPVAAVLHPGMSGCLIGVAPADLVSDGDWGSPEWILCGEVSTVYAQQVVGWDYLHAYTIDIIDPEQAIVNLEVVNRNYHWNSGLYLQGIVRDPDGRVCGTVLPSSVDNIKPGTTRFQSVEINSTLDYIANPFTLIVTIEDVHIEFTLQPWLERVNPSCSVVMPWNQ